MSRKGFTLVELMIVVAIISVLAAIGVPRFWEMQLETKIAEARVNVAGIWEAQQGYDATYDSYIDTGGWVPAAIPGKATVAWPSGTAFDDLEWSPDGKIRCRYRSVTVGTDLSYVAGECDADGDAVTWFHYREDGDGTDTELCMPISTPRAGLQCF